MDAVEEIKSRLSIEDVIGEYLELKRAGRNFKAISPFSNEKTPSFMVSPEKQIWHDFSSGKGGNMFSFVMEMEGLDFKGALELLARKAGVDLSEFRGSDQARGKQKERLYGALELATKFYQVHFSKNKAAFEYIFKKRQYTKETALTFKIGFSPSNGTALYDFLKKQGFSEQEMKQAGLITQRYRGHNDMFRGRIMIPLMDQTGRVIGFTARLLNDEPNAPKYINTPQTILYDKSRHVYGLHLAKEAIRKNKYAVVVEGNLDVIASHQAGINQVVATAGTAMTEQHFKALGRFTNDVRLAFDQDNAGLAAVERVIPLAHKADISLRIITVPSGKDPDELIKKEPKTWQDIVEKPQYAVDWLIDRYKDQLDITTAEGKRKFTDVLLGTIRKLSDTVEQDHYIKEVAKITGINEDAIRQKAKGTKLEARRPKKVIQKPEFDASIAELVKIQNHLMALALMLPAMRDYLDKLTTEMLPEEPARGLMVFLKAHKDFDGRQSEVKELRNIGDYVKMVALLFEELYQSLEVIELHYEATRLQVRLIEQHVKTQKAVLAEALHSANESETQRLLTKAKELDKLLKLTNKEENPS